MRASACFLLWFSLLAASKPLCAQRNYTEAMQQGRASAQKGYYGMAIKKYRAAQAFEPSKRAEVDREIDAAFVKIRQQRDEAIKEKERAEKAEKTATRLVQQLKAEKQKALSEKEKALSAEQKALDVLDKIYFFEDRYGLAFDKTTDRYGFIDKDLTVKIPFQYEEALPFNHNGHARVRIGLSYYLIDTLGQQYPLATELAQLNPSITAIDLRRQELTEIPAVVFKNTQLKVLLLDENHLASLPPAIGQLSNLQMLDLTGNQLSTLPGAMAQLKKLQFLYLESNRLTSLPAETGQAASLQILDVSGNQLTDLPPEIGELTNLLALNLGHNQLSSLPEEIWKLTQLKSMDLSKNSFSIPTTGLLQKHLPACTIKR